MNRKSEYYTKELLKSAAIFDSKENTYSRALIDYFNHYVIKQEGFRNFKLKRYNSDEIPQKVIWIDGTQDNLPATRESCRILGNGIVIDNRNELLNELKEFPSETLILSHCVTKECYDIHLSENIEKNMNSVVSPGYITAPGALFSDKLKTYNLLSSNRTDWDLVAKYFEVFPGKKSPDKIASEILDIVDNDAETNSFFIKPTEGGGGLGGFRLLRITKNNKIHYIIPDLSRVSGEFENPHIVNLTIDPQNSHAIDELWWLYNKFLSSKILSKNYIKVKLNNKAELKKLLAVKNYKNILTRKAAEKKLTSAIEKFEKKFNRRYYPLVSHYIDFGTWGLRAHYRMTQKGIQLETIYSRIFQIGFTEDGIGYLGSDNISNKQTGELEVDRLVPINELMVKSIGGEDSLVAILMKGAIAMKKLINTLPENLRDRVPVRVQFDLATVSGIIGEGNADSARGFCLAQEWNSFKKNTMEWYNDSVSYYNYKKSHPEIDG